MYKWYIILFILFVLHKAYSQEVLKRNAIQIQTGITGRSLILGTGYSYSISRKFYMQIEGQYESFRKETISRQELGTLNTTYLNLFGAYTIAKIREKVFLNAILGLSGAKEKLKYIFIEKSPTQQSLLGGLIGVEISFLISQKIRVDLNGNQRYYPESTIGSQRWFAGLGIKYCF